MNKKIIIGIGFFIIIGIFGFILMRPEPEPVPADFDNQADCEAANFYWWNDTCNLEAEAIPVPVPVDFDNQADCEAANFYWWNDTCNLEVEELLSFSAPFDPEAIMIDPITGKEIVSNQVIVRFKEDVSKATREALIAKLDSIIVGGIPMLDIYQLKIPDDTIPPDLVIQFEKSPYVKWAEVNHITGVDPVSIW